MSASGTCEQELVAAAKLGHAEAITELDRRLRPRLVRWLRGRVNSVADAEDLAQQTLTRGILKLDRYEPHRPIWSWMRKIADRIAIDHARRNARHTAVGIEAFDIAADAPGPDTGLLDAERRTCLWDLVGDALPANQATILRLHYVEDLDAGQIAERMRISRVNVRVLLCRARKRLLERRDAEPDDSVLIGEGRRPERTTP